MASDRVLILATVTAVKDCALCYPSCSLCNKRLLTSFQSQKLWCSKCCASYTDHSSVQRFRLSLRVTDDDSTADVTVFGKCLEAVVGGTAQDYHKYKTWLDDQPFLKCEDLIMESLKRCLVGRKFYFGFKINPLKRSLSKCLRPVSLSEILAQQLWCNRDAEFSKGLIAIQIVVAEPEHREACVSGTGCNTILQHLKQAVEFTLFPNKKIKTVTELRTDAEGASVSGEQSVLDISAIEPDDSIQGADGRTDNQDLYELDQPGHAGGKVLNSNTSSYVSGISDCHLDSNSCSGQSSFQPSGQVSYGQSDIVISCFEEHTSNSNKLMTESIYSDLEKFQSNRLGVISGRTQDDAQGSESTQKAYTWNYFHNSSSAVAKSISGRDSVSSFVRDLERPFATTEDSPRNESIEVNLNKGSKVSNPPEEIQDKLPVLDSSLLGTSRDKNSSDTAAFVSDIEAVRNGTLLELSPLGLGSVSTIVDDELSVQNYSTKVDQLPYCDITDLEDNTQTDSVIASVSHCRQHEKTILSTLSPFNHKLTKEAQYCSFNSQKVSPKRNTVGISSAVLPDHIPEMEYSLMCGLTQEESELYLDFFKSAIRKPSQAVRTVKREPHKDDSKQLTILTGQDTSPPRGAYCSGQDSDHTQSGGDQNDFSPKNLKWRKLGDYEGQVENSVVTDHRAVNDMTGTAHHQQSDQHNYTDKSQQSDQNKQTDHWGRETRAYKGSSMGNDNKQLHAMDRSSCLNQTDHCLDSAQLSDHTRETADAASVDHIVSGQGKDDHLTELYGSFYNSNNDSQLLLADLHDSNFHTSFDVPYLQSQSVHHKDTGTEHVGVTHSSSGIGGAVAVYSEDMPYSEDLDCFLENMVKAHERVISNVSVHKPTLTDKNKEDGSLSGQETIRTGVLKEEEVMSNSIMAALDGTFGSVLDETKCDSTPLKVDVVLKSSKTNPDSKMGEFSNSSYVALGEKRCCFEIQKTHFDPVPEKTKQHFDGMTKPQQGVDSSITDNIQKEEVAESTEHKERVPADCCRDNCALYVSCDLFDCSEEDSLILKVEENGHTRTFSPAEKVDVDGNINLSNCPSVQNVSYAQWQMLDEVKRFKVNKSKSDFVSLYKNIKNGADIVPIDGNLNGLCAIGNNKVDFSHSNQVDGDDKVDTRGQCDTVNTAEDDSYIPEDGSCDLFQTNLEDDSECFPSQNMSHNDLLLRNRTDPKITDGSRERKKSHFVSKPSEPVAVVESQSTGDLLDSDDEADKDELLSEKENIPDTLSIKRPKKLCQCVRFSRHRSTIHSLPGLNTSPNYLSPDIKGREPFKYCLKQGLLQHSNKRRLINQTSTPNIGHHSGRHFNGQLQGDNESSNFLSQADLFADSPIATDRGDLSIFTVTPEIVKLKVIKCKVQSENLCKSGHTAVELPSSALKRKKLSSLSVHVNSDSVESPNAHIKMKPGMTWNLNHLVRTLCTRETQTGDENKSRENQNTEGRNSTLTVQLQNVAKSQNVQNEGQDPIKLQTEHNTCDDIEVSIDFIPSSLPVALSHVVQHGHSSVSYSISQSDMFDSSNYN